MQNYDFSGTWHSSYTFSSESKDHDFTDEYDVQVHKIGNQVVIQSLPKDDGSYILLRLTQDGRVLTGIWYEQTAPGGHYKGVTYSGALQLVVDQDGNTMRGMWIGVDDELKMQSGQQMIVRRQAA